MVRPKDRLLENRRWLAFALALTAMACFLVFAPQAQAKDGKKNLAGVPAQSQVFDDDLRVESGQVMRGDVVVYNGDVTVVEGGRIQGNLTLYSGNVEIEAGGLVDGDITSLSGDVRVDGQVNGSISAVSGDVKLSDGASVAGDISVVSGQIDQGIGAHIGGSVLRGPDLKFPLPALIPGVPGIPQMPGMNPAPPGVALGPVGLMGRLFGFVGRVLVALLVLIFVAASAAAIATLRPQWVIDVRGTLNRQMALSFAIGLLVNILLLAFIGLLYFTVCLRPPALLLGIGLVALNVAGLAATGNAIGDRIAVRGGEQWSPSLRTGLGVLLPCSVIAFLWVLGSCFTFFGFLISLLLASFGTGAVLVKALKLGGSGAPVVAAPSVAEPLSGAPISPAAQADSPAAAAVHVYDVDQPVDSASTQQVPVESPTPQPTADSGTSAQDDFSQIAGIGPKLSQRLAEAGVRTFGDLAAKTPEEVSAIIGWSVERVVRGQLIEQARIKAEAR